jgi:hypothetical protein
MEALRLFEINTPFIQNIDKQHDKETQYGGQKRGPNLRIRLPNKYVTRTGWTINVQEEVEQAVTLTVGSPIGVDMYFTEAELAQNINDFSRDHIRPAITTLAAKLDSNVFQASYKSVYNSAGTAGTHPNNALPWLNAGALMSEFGAPQDMRKVVMDTNAQVNTVNGLLSLQNDPSKVSNQYISGRMGTDTLGYQSWYMSQNVPRHTCGTRSGTSILIDGTVATEGSTTIHVDGLGGATQTFTAGDVITVAAVNSVNVYTKQSTGRLQHFVVTADATAASSEVDLTVSPAMYTSASKALQNIDAFPQDGAAVTVVGTASTAYAQNLCFDPGFATFATASLEMPSDVHFKSQQSLRGINMRIMRQYDINNSNYPCRIDVYYGSVVQRPEFACRVWGG